MTEAETRVPETAQVSKKKRLPYREYRALVESKALRVLRKINFRLFLLLWAALIAVLFFGGRRFLSYCRESFELYENAQLSHFLESTVQQLNDADADALSRMLDSGIPEAAEFDSAEAFRMRNYELLAAADLTAKETRSAETGTHRYNLYADGAPVGNFEIVSAGQTSRLGLLVMDDWQYAGGNVSFTYERYDRTYTVPEGFTVTVNGIPLSDDYLTGAAEPIDTYRFAAEFADMPGMVTYRITDLLAVPDVVITDNNGDPVAVDSEAESVTLPSAWNSTEVPEDRTELILDTALLWSEYAMFDRKLSEVKTILIPDSELWVQAEKAYSNMIFVNEHTITGYENQSISEYTEYSENCFSCRVSMLRHIYVTRAGQDMPDTIDDVLFFYRTDLTDNGIDDPQWYLIDAFAAVN